MKNKKAKLKKLEEQLDCFKGLYIEEANNRKYVVYHSPSDDYVNYLNFGEVIPIYDLKECRFLNLNKFSQWSMKPVIKMIKEIWK